MNNEVRKETNLEHYKEELKEIVSYHYERPSVMTTEIKNRLDKNIVSGLGPGGERFTDVILNWMAQPYKEPILDDVEKEYLGAVIKPFRNRIRCICLESRSPDYCQIKILLNPIYAERDAEVLAMPTFKKDTMYKRMTFFKGYSLEELGL